MKKTFDGRGGRFFTASHRRRATKFAAADGQWYFIGAL
jgi:hypothetical protein